jgi:hypothetical protein
MEVGASHTHLTPVQVDILYSILARFDRLALQTGLPYTIACGTALGAVLRGGLIPWDTDADLFVRQSEFYKKLPAFQEACKGQLILERYTKWSDGRGWYKVYHPSASYPNVDIFMLDFDASHNIWRPYDLEIRGRAKMYLDPDQMGPPSRVRFGPLSLPLFPAPVRFLDRYYGPAWRVRSTEAEADKGAPILNTAFADFRPALPSNTTLVGIQ